MDDHQLTTAADAPSPVSTAVAFRQWLAALSPDALTDRECIDLVAEIERLKGSGAPAQVRLTHAVRQSREAASPGMPGVRSAPRSPWPADSRPPSATASWAWRGPSS